MRLLPVIIIIAIVVVVVFVWAIPSWYANIELDKQLYGAKAGSGVDFITVNLLNWAEIWAPLIPATIATIILIYPNKLIATITADKFERKGRRTVGVIFSLAVFGISYVISWLFNDLSYGLFMQQYSDPKSFVGFWDSFRAMTIPFNPEQLDVDVLFTWQYITLPIINCILTAFLVRMILELIGQRAKGGYPIEFLGKIFTIVGIIIAYFYFQSPLATYDKVERTWLYIVPLTMYSLLSVGVFCLILSKSKAARNREEVAGGAFLITIILVIAMIIVPCIAAAGDFFGREIRWREIVWDEKVSIEVEQTRIASNLTGFNYTGIDDLVSVPTNLDIIDRIRQFDKGSSDVKLENKIDNSYETKDDTDIVILDGSEYWLAPKSFDENFTEAFGNPVNRHMRYTSTSGFVAMDAHSGEDVANYSEAFGVSPDYPVYFGEGYRNDIILNQPENPEITSNYTGDPDGSLSGILGWWKVIGMSWDFLTIANQENEFLRRTNIFDRVEGMLLPFMYADPDPYLVFNKNEGRIYYSVPVYISLPGFAYYKTDYKRFLGWVLVDVANGEMDFYQSDIIEKDELISFAEIYLDQEIYPWNSTIPSWLENQLRYPEFLYESQLETDYRYHVQDWAQWKANQDLFERPENGDLYYVIMDLGEGLEFVGVDIVEPKSGSTNTLRGMYVLRLKPGHLGETIFYRVPDDYEPGLIGPTPARNTFATYPGISQNLTLVPNLDYGNILLYPFARSLYYVIPVYSTTGDGLQTLSWVGLVDGFNTSEVVWGNDAAEAFDKVRLLHPETGDYRPGDIEFNYTVDTEVAVPDGADIQFSVQNLKTNITEAPVNVLVNMTVYSNKTNVTINGSTAGIVSTNFDVDSNPDYAYLGSGINYTVQNYTLYPTQLNGTSAMLNFDLGNFSARDLYYRFVINLTFINSTNETESQIFDSPLEMVSFYSSIYSANNMSGSDILVDFTIPATGEEAGGIQIPIFLNNTNLSDAKDVIVNLTVFSHDFTNLTDNLTVFVPGPESAPYDANVTDPYYEMNYGNNYTIFNSTIGPLSWTGITAFLDLDIGGTTQVELICYMSLVVDGVVVARTGLRVITWASE